MSRTAIIAALLLLFSGPAFAYEAVFYCVHATGECLEGEATTTVAPDRMPGLLEQVFAEPRNYIGFIDEQGTILQFHVDAPHMLWADIPDPERQGSHGVKLSGAEAKALIMALQKPYASYRESLQMTFEPW